MRSSQFRVAITTDKVDAISKLVFKFKNSEQKIPSCAGVYQFFNKEGVTIYIGKSINLRRRLAQYQNAKRCRKHYKMWMIYKQIHKFEIHLCSDELSALLLENKMIQELRPRFNVQGAFSFLYPYIGYKYEKDVLTLLYTSEPEAFPEYLLFGAFRSKHRVKDAFYSMSHFFEFIGHKDKGFAKKQEDRISFGHVFRKVPARWVELLALFLRGEKNCFLKESFLILLEKPSALKAAARMQDDFDQLKRFYRFEANSLYKVMKKMNKTTQNIKQNERDALFLSFVFREVIQPSSES